MRLGILLWVFSYLPFPVILSGILHWAGFLDTDKSTATFIGTLWAIQIIIGFIGLYFAGREAIASVKGQGIRKLPKTVWEVMRGHEVTE